MNFFVRKYFKFLPFFFSPLLNLVSFYVFIETIIKYEKNICYEGGEGVYKKNRN